MNLESGHTYRDVAGRMRGPMVFRPDLSLLHGVYSALGSPCHFRDDGTPAVTPGDRTNDWPSYRLIEILTPNGWVNPDRNPPCIAQELADEPILDAASGQQKAEPAWKQDGGKPRLDLIAPEFLFGTAEVLRFGADKYAQRNWEKGMSWGRCFGAMMRHMWAWWGGEATDKETGLSHLWHAACCLMFLIAYEQRKIGTDDRKNPVDNS